MKPISVRFQCFGPYVQEQFVDFTQLEPHGLFLICGETGSGKTTILDAMCYALYGRSSGGLRGDMSVMRCKQADPKDETFVEFIFDCGDHRYRFFRSLKPRKKRKTKEESDKKQSVQTDFNATCECQILTDGVFTPLSDAKDKATFLNAMAETLIGLSYDQFRQVIILPQGQFEQLLVSKSEDKEKILVTLFHAERWQAMANRLYELADQQSKELDREKLLITDKLKRYSCTTPEELSEKASAAGAELVTLLDSLAAAEVALAKQTQLRDTALLDNQEFQQRDTLKKQLDSLRSQDAAFAAQEALLARADLAESITPVFQEYRNIFQQFSKALQDQTHAQESLKAAEAQLTAVQQERQLHESGNAKHTENKQRILELTNARPLYATLSARETAVRTAKTTLVREQATAEKARKNFQEANAAWEAAIIQQRKATEAYDAAQQKYLRSIGSTLAQQLQDGKPCPVCGSLSHPQPAPPAQDTVTEAQLDAFTKTRNQANRQEEKLRKQRMDAEKAHNSAHAAFTEQERILAVAEAEYASALQQQIPGIQTETQLMDALQALNQAVERYEAADLRLTEKHTNAKAALQAATVHYEKTREVTWSVSAALDEKKAKWNASWQEAGFESDTEYEHACMEPDKKKALRSQLVAFRTRLTEAQKAYDTKCSALESRQQPDVASIESTFAALQTQRDQAKRALILAQQEQETMQKDAETLAKQAKAYETRRIAAEESMVFAKRLRGDFGVSLQRYVLGVMLTSITSAANQLLKTVYAGRYQLYRTNESSGSARKRGLELEVFDANSGERRSVTTLSGGEKFLVSLSLAIGLSTVVQAQGTGVRLEAMFIDEGFGSLDRESINDALEILHGIRRSSGLVGIISHVEQLSETIPAKIRITKSANGSHCKIEY